MNLTRALDVALPEIPARTLSRGYPRLDPGITFREHEEDGKPIFRIYAPSVGGMFKLPPANWALAQLFDGSRSYEEIAELYSQQTGMEYGEDQVCEFAAELDAAEFWYRTPQEKNIHLMQQTTEERRKKRQVRSRWADLSIVIFPAFNPDRFLTWSYRYTKFLYSAWFTVITVLVFSFTAGITIAHWGEISRDTVDFYNFRNKTWNDVFFLYVISMFIVAAHEFGHAHACKHYGGRVPAMGFALVYLTPAFYTDTTEGIVMASRYERLVISLAGIWAELIICAIATPIWWGTPPDTLLHDGAYFIMMLTGIMSIIMNWNPLMKLDGYHMLCEFIGVADLKEDSTNYVSAWLKKYIWRLPTEVPYVPKSRRLGFAVYAFLSGAYSYMVLFFVARFAGNVVRNFSPDWGFLPEIGVAVLIFRSRIRLLVNFMKFLYLDKKDRIVVWFTPRHSLLVGGLMLALLALPIWRESVAGRFILEPGRSAVVRARVPGLITDIFVKEGQKVMAGDPLATLRNLPLESDYERAQARLMLASERYKVASLHYSGYGSALKEEQQMVTRVQDLSDRRNGLKLTSPISGTILTPRVEQQLGSYLSEGNQFLEVADLSTLRVRIYISEYDLSKIKSEAPAEMQVDGFLKKWSASVKSVAAYSSEMDPRLLGDVKLEGMNPPHFYLVDIALLDPQEEVRPGMTGLARVYGRRRSFLGKGLESFQNFWARKLW
ncbi:MAG TPA: efflux RND transporter periplasmic adaptor subunit [Candidatus Acidoferrales bacterium]|nr:efflux RND transporter periplasmic adaptor subunit [Candidatus Acidoferrales bacterium]